MTISTFLLMDIFVSFQIILVLHTVPSTSALLAKARVPTKVGVFCINDVFM